MIKLGPLRGSAILHHPVGHYQSIKRQQLGMKVDWANWGATK